MTMRQWCRLTGMDTRRAERTLQGDPTATVPHWTPAMLAALSVPGAMERAKLFAETFIIEDEED